MREIILKLFPERITLINFSSIFLIFSLIHRAWKLEIAFPASRSNELEDKLLYKVVS